MMGTPARTATVLIASVEEDDVPVVIYDEGIFAVRIARGDHSRELQLICTDLINASKHAATDVQKQYIIKLIDSFRSGDLETYRDSLKLWLRDNRPAVETIFGFIEPYRDPAGIRAEFEGLSAIADKQRTEQLVAVYGNASKFVRRLPWCGLSEGNDGKGPFEKKTSKEADFTSIHTVAYCSSIIFPGINLPNYNDIR